MLSHGASYENRTCSYSGRGGIRIRAWPLFKILSNLAASALENSVAWRPLALESMGGTQVSRMFLAFVRQSKNSVEPSTEPYSLSKNRSPCSTSSHGRSHHSNRPRISFSSSSENFTRPWETC